MSKSIKKLTVFLLAIIAIAMLYSNVNAANPTIKETTKTNDGYTTIQSGSIIIGITRFTPETVVTGVRAATAGANDMSAYISANGTRDGYSYPKMYYYILGEWYEYDVNGKLKSTNNISSVDIYYVNNELKAGASIPVKPEPEVKEEYNVFFLDGSRQVEVKTVKSGEKLNSLPILPEKQHFTYTWVDKAGNTVTNETVITDDTVVFSKWVEDEKATMTLKVAGEEDEVITKYVGETIIVDEPVKAGNDSVTYTFSGWYTENGDPYVINKMPSGGKVLIAGWNAEVKQSENVDLKDVIDEVKNEDVTATVTVSNDLKVEENLNIPENVNLIIAPGKALRLGKNATIENVDRITKQEGAIIQKEADDKDSIIEGLKVDYADEVILSNNVDLSTTSALVIDGGTDGKVLNLDDKSVNVEGLGVGIITRGNVTLKGTLIEGQSEEQTVKGITCTAEMSLDKQHKAIENYGNLTVDSVTIKQYYGIYNCHGATMNIKNSNITAYHAGVCGLTDSNTTIDNTTINSKWYGVAGNGTQSNAVMTIKNNSTITSNEDVAIYFPSTESLVIDNSTITGLVGIEACAGHISVKNGSTITATGGSCYTNEQLVNVWDAITGKTFVGNNISAASAIFFRIQQAYGKGTNASITVDETSKLVSENGGYGIRVYEAKQSSNVNSVVALEVSSKGTFTGTAGHDMEIFRNKDENDTFKANINVANMDVNTSAGLMSALENPEVKEVTLNEEVTLTEKLVIPDGKEITINLNGKTITSATTENGVIENNGTLTLEGATPVSAVATYSNTRETATGGIVANKTHAIYNTIKGTLIINGGTYDALANGKAALYNQGGTVTINGGTFKRSNETGIDKYNGGENSWYTVLNHGIMTIEDGTFENNGHFSSMFANGYYNYSSTDQNLGHIDGVNIERPTLTINGGNFSGGVNTVKNDDNAELIINDGLFTGYTQCALMNFNNVEINGGVFDGTGDGLEATIYNTFIVGGKDAGNLVINAGTFKAPGEGLAIRINTAQGTAGTVEINGGSFLDKEGNALTKISDDYNLPESTPVQ